MLKMPEEKLSGGFCMKKGWMLALAILCTAAGFVSAGGQSGSPGTSAGTESGKARLVFWDMVWNSDPYPMVAQELVKKFNAQSTTSEIVDYNGIAWDGYVQNYTTAIASGAGPDMGTGGSSLQHLFAKMGEIVNLDPLIEQWKADGSISDFGPGVLENIRYEGHQIGIPWQFDPRMMWYNKDYFQQAGITKMPANQDEFYQVLVKLKKSLPDVAPFVLAGKAHYEMMSFWQMLAWDHGGGMVQDGKIIIDNEGSLKAFAYFKKLAAEGLVPQDVVAFMGGDPEKLFFQGGAAILFSVGDMPYTAVTLASDMQDKIDILPPFTRYNMNPANSIMAFKTRNPASAAIEAVGWWSKNGMPLFTEGRILKVPVRKSFAAQITEPWLEKINKLIIPVGMGNGYPSKELYPQYQTIMGDGVITIACQKLFVTNDSIQSIAAAAKAELESILKN
jgi:multiple sugar transport system substrate-binding protein